MVPSNIVQQQGIGVVSADNTNTWVQVCDTVATLRNFTGVGNMGVLLEGYNTPGDGGAGLFWFNSNVANGVDDGGITTVVPNGTTIGAWIRLGFLVAAGGTQYLIPLTGFAIAVAPSISTLILNPSGTLTAGSVTFPAAPQDGQTFLLATAQTITTLTLSGGSTVISNAPTTLVAGAAFKYQYVAAANTWFRIT